MSQSQKEVTVKYDEYMNWYTLHPGTVIDSVATTGDPNNPDFTVKYHYT